MSKEMTLEEFENETFSQEFIFESKLEYAEIERDIWKARAALWKRCAKNLFVSGWTGAQFNAQLYRDLRRKHKSLKAENEALKNDARELAEWAAINAPEYLRESARRILEATKEGE